jgi:hypothetical protein
MKVIVDRNRHAALLVKQSTKWVHILRASGHGLTAQRLSEDELTGEWSELTQASVESALNTFTGIGRTKGATKGALALLGEACTLYDEEEH